MESIVCICIALWTLLSWWRPFGHESFAGLYSFFCLALFLHIAHFRQNKLWCVLALHKMHGDFDFNFSAKSPQPESMHFRDIDLAINGAHRVNVTAYKWIEDIRQFQYVSAKHWENFAFSKIDSRALAYATFTVVLVKTYCRSHHAIRGFSIIVDVDIAVCHHMSIFPIFIRDEPGPERVEELKFFHFHYCSRVRSVCMWRVARMKTNNRRVLSSSRIFSTSQNSALFETSFYKVSTKHFQDIYQCTHSRAPNTKQKICWRASSAAAANGPRRVRRQWRANWRRKCI